MRAGGLNFGAAGSFSMATFNFVTVDRSGRTSARNFGWACDGLRVGHHDATTRDEELAPQSERLLVLADGDQVHDGGQVRRGDPGGDQLLRVVVCDSIDSNAISARPTASLGRSCRHGPLPLCPTPDRPRDLSVTPRRQIVQGCYREGFPEAIVRWR